MLVAVLNSAIQHNENSLKFVITQFALTLGWFLSTALLSVLILLFVFIKKWELIRNALLSITLSWPFIAVSIYIKPEVLLIASGI